MNPQTIVLTGASGFLGSHLAQELAANGFRVIALVRSKSDLWRCNEFEGGKLVFLNGDAKDCRSSLQKYKPSILIHSSWQGVAPAEREDADIQARNIQYTTWLLNLARELNIKKIIAFGSQAEYGYFDGRINEEAVCNPVSAYGNAKFTALGALRSFCEDHSVNWFWIRLFSIYGTRENREWLFPSVIINARNNFPMDLTKCEQKYDYLYVKDFCRAMIKMLETECASGIFNLTSNSSTQLKGMIETIRNMVNPDAVLNFGALPYRQNQVMQMEGDSSKFNKQFSFKIKSTFEDNIRQVVNYYLNKPSGN